MKSQVTVKSGINLKDVSAIVFPIISLLMKISEKSCDSPILRYVMVVFLAISLILLLISFHPRLKNEKGRVKLLFYLICLVGYGLLTIWFFSGRCDLTNQKGSNTSTKVTVNNNQHINKGTINNDNSQHIDNSITNNFNRPAIRKLNSIDIARLKSTLVDKDAKIIVQYLKTNSEDSLLWKKIFKTLIKLGYSNVSLSVASSLPGNLNSGTITILQPKIDQQVQYKVIINPQR